MMETSNKLKLIRQLMQQQGIDALLVPSNDPHFSEYPAPYWSCRRWASGFTGSAGTLVITLTNAALWTDSRYFIQASNQLDSSIELMKEGLSGTPLLSNWLGKELKVNQVVACNAQLLSIDQEKTLQQSLHEYQLILQLIPDLFSTIWIDRKTLGGGSIQTMPLSISGKSFADKQQQIMAKFPAHASYLVTALDEIAWLFNIRGQDVAYNPVALAYAVIDRNNAHLFILKQQLSSDRLAELESNHITIHNYSDIDLFLNQLPDSTCLYINSSKTNVHLYQQISAQVNICFEKDTVGCINQCKAIKNEVELSGFRQAMLADGVALLKFWDWLLDNSGKETLTECSAAQQLEVFRSEGTTYLANSFSTISAYAANAALPHYSAHPETKVKIGTDSFFLLDSGAHYTHGTTDITRTFHLGTPTDFEKLDYTLVLKGMISLSDSQFLEGTRGTQLDILARQYLWKAGKNYMHGTGHGVGHYLNVHEGPHSIRMNENPVALVPGMVMSNEPAVYYEGRYGIRIENLIACKHSIDTQLGRFFNFETLSLCPINTEAIDFNLMEQHELQWLNTYHAKVQKSLAPLLSGKVLNLLLKLTAPL